ncbi:MAG: glycosyltransferase [Sphingobacteriales bacterium]|nr:MAG: glycosyltransferase [Sphingobacteriales bacterium]
MNISVIIVNYNVKYFLEQCLCSVQKALINIKGEVIVIDNFSTDGSIEYLSAKFPSVQFIVNDKNYGFGKACNQGLAIAKGKYILFLNPDTLVPEDCFEKSVAFMESHPDAGAMGIRMLDGSGNFLKESKRAFPSPQTSFYKLTGLAKLFPRSKTFSRYHLGYLDEHKNHIVDVLAGAYLLVRKEILEKVGGFDEVFFMYGEDVDLSYRIQKAGYNNYYFAGSSIIHFKGESTRKGSLNYVKMFYQAMSVFVKKHYGSQKAVLFNFFIQAAIWFRAWVSSAGHFIKWVGLPVIDALIILFSFWTVKILWEVYVRPEVIYQERLIIAVFPMFTVIYLFIAYYTGLYNKYFQQGNLNRSALTATLTVLAIYSLLPESLRFSRGIILFGSVLAFLLLSLIRKMMVNWKLIETDGNLHQAKTLVVCGIEEAGEINQLLITAGKEQQVFGRIGIIENDPGAIGNINEMPPVIKELGIKEIIFGEGELSNKQIIELVQQMTLRYKFHAKNSGSIIGSNSKDQAGDYLAMEKTFVLAQPISRRNKKLWDEIYCLFFLLSFPVHFILQKKPVSFFKNVFAVFSGKKTWVSYHVYQKQLPPLNEGILTPTGLPKTLNHLPLDSLQKIDYWYAKDYSISSDISLIWKNYQYLGE